MGVEKNVKKILDLDPALIDKIIRNAKNNFLNIRIEHIQKEHRKKFQDLIDQYYDFIKELTIFNRKLGTKLHVYQNYKYGPQEYIAELKEKLAKEILDDQREYEKFIQRVLNLIHSSTRLFNEHIFVRKEVSYLQIFSFILGCFGLIAVLTTHIALPILLPFDGFLVGLLSTVFVALGLPSIIILVDNLINWFRNASFNRANQKLEKDIKEHLKSINIQLGEMQKDHAMLEADVGKLGREKHEHPNQTETAAPLFAPETLAGYVQKVQQMDKILQAALCS